MEQLIGGSAKPVPTEKQMPQDAGSDLLGRSRLLTHPV